MRALALLLLAPAMAAAQDRSTLLTCPGSLRLTPRVALEAPAGWRALPAPQTHWLRGARLFSGDPAEEAELVPDNPRPRAYRWTLAAHAAPQPWLVCAYEGTEASIAAAVPAAATVCLVATYHDNARGIRNGSVVIGPSDWVRALCR